MNLDKGIYIAGLILLLVYYFVPVAWVKLLLGLCLLILCDICFPQRFKIIAAQMFVTFLFLSVFIMTPFSHALAHVLKIEDYAIYLIFLAILLCAIAWIYALLKLSHIDKDEIENKPNPNLLGIVKQYYPYLTLLIPVSLILSPTLDIDFSYGGDEHYHAMSIVLCQQLFFTFRETPAAFLLMSISVFLACLIITNKSVKEKPFVLGFITSMFVIIFGSCWLIAYSNIRLDYFTIERALRYQCSEPWISAFLGFLDYSYLESSRTNGQHAINNFGIMRLLPALSYLLLGYLIYRRMIKTVDNICSAAIALAFFTIPIFLYESALLYLEMPLVAALLIVFLDSEKLITLPAKELPKRISFYALISLQFFKESGVLIALVLVLLRVLFNLKEISRSNNNSRMFPMLKSELPIVFISLFGGLLYLGARSLTPYRPYSLHLENILDLSLWGKGLYALFEQYRVFVVLIIPTALNIIHKKSRHIMVCLAVAGAVWLFYFLEKPEWVGLARFNLLIAPSVIIISMHIFQLIYEKAGKKYLYAFLFLLLALNLIDTPYELTGYRKDWGGSGERWYNWSQCLSDIKREKTNARIIVANMPYKYGFGLIFAKLNWFPDLKEEKPIFAGNESEDFKATLEMFEKSNAEFLIYRYEKLLDDKTKINNFIKQSNFEVFGEYPSAVGGLIVVKK